MTPRGYADTDLNAYLDGEMTGAELAEFEAWLAANPEMRVRLDEFTADRLQLRSALDPVLDEAVPDRLLRTLREAGPAASARAPAWRRLAAAVAIFSLGLGAGWAGARLWTGQESDMAVTAERALDAHRVYVTEVLHPVEVGADQTDHLVAWLSKRLGHRLTAPKLGAAGYRLVGGRLLPGDGTAAAQFMYENGTGGRVTLYIGLNPQGRETAFHLVDRGGTRAFYWLDGPLGYALAGDIDEDRLLKLARAVYAQTIDAEAGEP